MTHGRHWGALVADLRLDLPIQLASVLAKGWAVTGEADADEEPAFLALEYPALSPLRHLVVLRTLPTGKRLEVHAAYPYLAEGELVALEVVAMSAGGEDGAGFEGILELATASGFLLTAFDPLYHLHRASLVRDPHQLCAVAALAYAVAAVTDTEVILRDADLVAAERARVAAEWPHADLSQIDSVTGSIAELRTVIPLDEPGDVEFQSVVEATGEFELEGMRVWWMRLSLRPDDESPLPCTLYASEPTLGDYRPKCGDIVRGMAWLQVLPMEPSAR